MANNKRILLVEERSPPCRNALAVARSGGIWRDGCAAGATARERLSERTTTAVVLYLMLALHGRPGVFLELRAGTHPVLILTARGDAIDRIVALNSWPTTSGQAL